MSDKRKWPRGEALALAEELQCWLEPVCERVLICGSIRREKREVGDIELVYIPRMQVGAAMDFFTPARPVSVVEGLFDELLTAGRIAKRLNVNGTHTWGQSNKLATHCGSGIAVDFFATNGSAWWNYVVCRTGGAVSNTRIASEAKARGWMWHPTGEGFERRTGPDTGRVVPMRSEREVFEFVRLPYLEPKDRP